MKETLFADALTATLSAHAARHLRRARVLRTAPMPAESLRQRLAALRVPHREALVELEQAAGVGRLPDGRSFGVSPFLELAPRDLPRVDGEPVFPILGLAEHAEEWESAFAMLAADGSVSLYEAPHGPAPVLASWRELLELEALAPLGVELYELRVDGHVGQMVADLIGASAHSPATGTAASSFVGTDVFIKELRTRLPAGTGLSGTFISAERLAPLVDLAMLLADEGLSLGYRGPFDDPPKTATDVLTFIDAAPRVGYKARAAVRIWRHHAMCGATRNIID
jgi:hypothetical protein